MTTSREMVLIGGIAKALRDAGSWTGETHIQKAAYIAKEKLNVPFESEFVLYKHGPFSFDLNKSIVHMLSRGLLTAETHAGYGPSLRVTEPLWTALDKKLGGLFAQFEPSVNLVSAKLGRKNVAELERIATAVYVSINFPDKSLSERANRIATLKPHINLEMARGALKEAEQIH